MVESDVQQNLEKKLKALDQKNAFKGAEEHNNHPKHHKAEILGTFEEIYDSKTVIDIEDMFDKCKDSTKKVLVLGQAGIGKSTFCQFVTHQWAKGELWPQYELLVLIRLRTLREDSYPRGKKYSLIDLVENEYFQVGDITENDRQYFKQKCDEHRVLWVLDGYDEFSQNISQHLEPLLKHIYKEHHHILTSRPYAIKLAYDVQIEITGFTDDNIPKYVQQFFDQIKDDLNDAPMKAHHLLTFLRENDSVWGIAHLPMNLELICSLWGDNDWSQTKTFTLTVLYDAIIEWFCRRYLEKQNIDHIGCSKQDVYTLCHIELGFLEILAFKAMETNCIILSPTLVHEVQRETEQSLQSFVRLLKIGILKSYNDKPIGSQVITAQQHYFIHLSIQEHLAARYLLKNLQHIVKKKAIQFIQAHKYNQRLRSVFVFAAGLLAQSEYQYSLDDFWSIIKTEPLDHIGLQHLQLTIQCLQEIGDQIIFSQQITLLQTISQYFHVYTNVQQETIRQNMRTIFRHMKSLTNISFIQEQLLQLLQSTNDHIVLDALEIISTLTLSDPSPDLLTQLKCVLGHYKWRLRYKACDVLRNIGEKTATNEVITVLIGAIKDKHSYVRSCACYALGEIAEKQGMNEVMPPLIAALRHKHPHVRWCASAVMWKIAGSSETNDIITFLINACRMEALSASKWTCDTLGDTGKVKATNTVIIALFNALQDQNSQVRWSASAAIGNILKKAAPTDIIAALIMSFRNEDSDNGKWIRRALGTISEMTAAHEVITTLNVALRNEDSDPRRSACDALGTISEKPAMNMVIGTLITAVQDRDPDVRESAHVALERVGEKIATSETIAALIMELRNDNWHIGSRIRDSLWKICEKAATNEVITALIRGLQETDPCIRSSVCDVLGKIGKKTTANEVITVLISALADDDDSDVRCSACCALGEVGEKAATNKAIAALIVALRDKDLNVRASACASFGKMYEKATTNEVTDAMMVALRDEHLEVRKRACDTLEKIGEKVATHEITNVLFMELRNEVSDVKQRACNPLENIAEKAVINGVVAALDKAIRDKSSEIRKRACDALGKISEKAPTNEAVTALVVAVQNEDSYVRWRACSVLGNIGEKAPTNKIITALTVATRDDDSHVRIKACGALLNIGEKGTTCEVISCLLNELDRSSVNTVNRDVCQLCARALSVMTVLKVLDPSSLPGVLKFLRSKWANFEKIASDHWMRALLETKNVQWASIVAYAALLQRSGITVRGNVVNIFNGHETFEYSAVHPELVECLIEACRNVRRELGYDYIDIHDDQSVSVSTWHSLTLKFITILFIILPYILICYVISQL